MNAAKSIFEEIRALAALPSPRKQSTAGNTSPTTAALAANVLSDLVPQASTDWLQPVSGLFEDLIAKAQDGGVTDRQLEDAIHRAALSAPEIFQRVDAQALQRAMERAMGPAVVAGALEFQEAADAKI